MEKIIKILKEHGVVFTIENNRIIAEGEDLTDYTLIEVYEFLNYDILDY